MNIKLKKLNHKVCYSVHKSNHRIHLKTTNLNRKKGFVCKLRYLRVSIN